MKKAFQSRLSSHAGNTCLRAEIALNLAAQGSLADEQIVECDSEAVQDSLSQNVRRMNFQQWMAKGRFIRVDEVWVHHTQNPCCSHNFFTWQKCEVVLLTEASGCNV